MSQHPKCLYRFQKKQKLFDFCFAQLPRTPIEFVQYVCKVDKDLTIKQIKFYLNFIGKVLDKKRYTYRIFLFPQDSEFKIRIYFKLNAEGFKRVQTLLYLTFFRYPQEFPIFIQEMYKANNLTTAKLFAKFQKLHLEVISGSLKNKYNTLHGHGLIYFYDKKKLKDFKLKSLRQFKKDINNVKSTVQGYFL